MKKKIVIMIILCLLILTKIYAQDKLEPAGNLKLIAPDKAPVGSPVQFSVEGMPENAAEYWLRNPKFESDVWLELYNRQGEPVNIFWSSDQSIRTFVLIVAANGPDIPVLDVAEHKLQYGLGPGPGPGPVPPVPAIIPKTPSVGLQEAVLPLVQYAQSRPIERTDLLNLIEFYYDFAGIVARDSDNKIIKNTAQFRAVYSNAGRLMYQQTGMKGKYAGLAEIVDGIIADNLGLDVVALNHKLTSEILMALAWAFYKSVGDK